MTKRYLYQTVKGDALAANKMAFISGPRQVGKTTLAKEFLSSEQNYFNWDQTSFRKTWAKNPDAILEQSGAGIVVLDEIHKDRRWKQRLKGLYDSANKDVQMIITGSARLDIYRKGGDSLLGRYIPYRLHPFTAAESSSPSSPMKAFEPDLARVRFNVDDLLSYGSFPEPLFAANVNQSKRWSRLRLERLVQEDVRDLRNIQDLSALTVLCDFLPSRVGSLLSINNLREDVGVAYATVRDWIQVLATLYVCFLVKPYAAKLNRMVTSEPKLYLFDYLQIDDPGAKLENLTALHLLKACDYWTDSAQGLFTLNFVRSKDKKEVDFLIVRDKKPWMLVECKSNNKKISPSLLRFKDQLKTPFNFQLVKDKSFHRFDKDNNIHISDYCRFFSCLV